MASLEPLLAGLGHHQHLEREKAVQRLTVAFSEHDDFQQAWTVIENAAESMLQSPDWQQRLGGLSALTTVWRQASLGGDQGLQELYTSTIAACLALLEDPEVRVRQAVGECLHHVARVMGSCTYTDCGPTVLRSIQEHFDRPDDGDEAPPTDLLQSLVKGTYEADAPGEGEMRHHTEGWKCLETSCGVLKRVMEGLGEAMAPHVSPELLSLLFRSFLHQNRFVRETAYCVLAVVVRVSAGGVLDDIAPQVAPKLRDGLSDNWSQVRYAASTAVRAFMLALGDKAPAFYPVLLAPMCLNRYYVAAGVRLYSQDTWKTLMGDAGRIHVAAHCGDVVTYYIMQSKANNHAVREAACACIAELMQKIDPEAVRPHIPPLLKALLDCFKDESWPVRDAACTACGRCVSAFPEDCSPILPELFDLWEAHLEDNVWSVRENSAVALGLAVRARGDAAGVKVAAMLRAMISRAKDQPEWSEPGLENTTLFGVAARRQRDNDVEAHSDQTMFSCGSLAPKLRRGGGCMDHGFSRDKQPWEASDGACFLMRELAGVTPQAVVECLPALAELTTIGHFPQATSLHETVFKCLPGIAQGLGKRTFKPHLELFIEPMFRALRCGHPLTEAAAGRAIGAVRDMLGPNIWAGRLAPDQLALMQDRNVPASSAGAMGSAPWSQ